MRACDGPEFPRGPECARRARDSPGHDAPVGALSERLSGRDPVILPPRAPASAHLAWVEIVDSNSCTATVGRAGGGRQNVWRNPRCDVGRVIHELGHPLGLFHTQSRYDRDTCSARGPHRGRPGRPVRERATRALRDLCTSDQNAAPLLPEGPVPPGLGCIEACRVRVPSVMCRRAEAGRTLKACLLEMLEGRGGGGEVRGARDARRDGPPSLRR